ncbi:DegV family protein [Nocardioides marmorisolisilvae]|uniref:DegV family protein n=1 Tax=Nocardioides marmorisolisilvae TaxID=1542737 RepID=A0A3N0DTD1_9ACTN|nr:DegV family protein [Nocardioides marmorisolisilvae]RNL78850.1 DegV family protein [Nocardioides marmorisolisilvae]
MSLALVTDSTASLTPEVASKCCVTVVPLQVVIGAESFDEGVEGGATPAMLAEALRSFRPVSTSRPNPDEMLEVYERLASEGATGIVSIHLSADLSGTFESAQLAAKRSPIPVVPVDSRQVGMGTGFAVLAAVEARDAGADASAVAEAAKQRASATTSLFYVDTLEYLRRGGRVGAVGALLGSALAVKPILKVEDGRIGPFERVRTAGKALSRLEELAVAAAGEAEVDVAVAHLASPERAETLAEKLTTRLAEGLDGREVAVGEIGAVLGAHVGPGMVAVSVARRTVHKDSDEA